MKHPLNQRAFALCSCVCLTAIPSALFADESTEPDPIEPLPSLDELLGLDESSSSDEPPIVDPNDAELEKVLSPQQAGEAFSQAVELMNRVSSRIANHQDLSIATQRLQEDILRKLDQVIESANENQSNSSSSSSSSSESESQQQQPDQQQSQEGQTGEPSDQSSEGSVPGGTSNAQPGDEVAPDGVHWGSLPARFRDALSQGISDRYSELYRSITEEYYKSLAEDND